MGKYTEENMGLFIRLVNDYEHDTHDHPEVMQMITESKEVLCDDELTQEEKEVALVEIVNDIFYDIPFDSIAQTFEEDCKGSYGIMQGFGDFLFDDVEEEDTDEYCY